MKSENSFIIRLEEVKSLLDKSGLLKHAIMKHDRKRTVIRRHIENVKQFKEFVDEVLLKNEYDFLLCDDSFFQFDRICSGEKIVYKYVFIQNPGIRIPFDEYCFKNEIDLEDENIDYVLGINGLENIVILLNGLTKCCWSRMMATYDKPELFDYRQGLKNQIIENVGKLLKLQEVKK